MVRQVKPKLTPAWKALLALSVAAGALLWHLLACTESPMAFSPDGENLAFVTMEPYDLDDMELVDTHVYRLMVLTKTKDLKVIEETTQYLLSAPAYSPDGKQLCYLQVPLLTQEKKGQLKETSKVEPKRIKIEFESINESESSAPVPLQDPDFIDLTIPPAEQMFNATEYIQSAAQLPAILVVRDAQTYEIKSRTKITVPLSQEGTELFTTYLLTQPLYSPNSQWIYLPITYFIAGVNPAKNEIRSLAGPITFGEKLPVTMAAVSSNGKTIATLTGMEDPILGLIQTDGQKTSYQRLKGTPSASGIVWQDDKTLILLIPPEEKDKSRIELRFLNADGSEQKTITVDLPGLKRDDDFATGELAISPNGRFLAISFLNHVYFLNMDGKTLNHIHHPAEAGLVQPTFSPDSQQVAFKYLAETGKNLGRVAEIVFFTPEGTEITRFKVPQSKFMQDAIEKRKAAQEKKETEKEPPASQKIDN